MRTEMLAVLSVKRDQTTTKTDTLAQWTTISIGLNTAVVVCSSCPEKVSLWPITAA